MFLNAMSAKKGISETLSPREIVLRQRLDWNNHCAGEFSEYVEAHEDRIVTNNVQELCTFPAIVLGPTQLTGNSQSI